ncbi:hypothetical protein GCM10009785_18410 [Brooklawnia cerclae]|uniref:Nucleotidyl transferase AbiEii/AbiGii toxin family protein n=1 Tax=Brooklawnia cerclae TaxID=349934 RepID=A0ABX0SGQ8_9ACTN|nr:nucleotidyl transferase AbiEii/AbiGii toxin family protein [Brooklawnia cerclae]NIH57587.1 hypothetical protein [Brooklawnia cerclae]
MATSEEAQRINQRIKSAARNTGIPVTRLRSRIAFQRVLARLALDHAWVLKGGFSLEMRLGLVARSTKDLDLWRLSAPIGSALDLQDTLDEALSRDLLDGFTFHVGLPRQMRIQDAEPTTWRIPIRAFYSGSLFTEATIDVVTTDNASSHETELLHIEPAVVGEAFSISALGLDRHAAEKYHACVRVYANDRPSTRVKDLVDLVLLIEGEWLRPAKLGAAVRRVFRERNNIDPPGSLPDRPPADWERTYASLARETGATVADVEEAWALASRTYILALEQEGEERVLR